MLHRFVLAVATIALLMAQPSFAQAQAPKGGAPKGEALKEMQRLGGLMAELQRLQTSTKLAEELELTPQQKQELLIESQKLQDAMMRRGRSGGAFDQDQYRKLATEFSKKVKDILEPKQHAKLEEMADARMEKQQASMPSPDQMKEMQKLSSMMQELQRLSYDFKLADQLEITPEQRIRIREASQKFTRAMQEMMKANEGQPMDMKRYNEMMGDLMMDAQDILTAEQAKKLSRMAKLKQLKQRFGDEFAMVNGLIEEFELSDSEKKKVAQTIKDARERFYAELKDLKQETLESIVDSVPLKHREEVSDAVETFLDTDPRKTRPGMTTIRVGG